MEYPLNRSRLILLYLGAFFASVMLTYLATAHQANINADGLCYILSAEAFTRLGLKQAMQLCGQANWPFYSVFLAVTARFTAFSYELSAVVLNAIFDAVSVVIFVMIIRLLSNKPRIVFLGLLTILCAHDFNSVRDIIIRDHGYWMCYLASIYFFLRYVRETRLVFAGAWVISILLASLFRIEGLVFFGLLPLCLLAFPGNIAERLKRVFILYLPHVAIAAIMLIAVLFFADQVHQYSGRLPLLLNKIQHSALLIATQFQTVKVNLLHHVLPIEAARDATLVMLLLLIFWYLITAVSQFSLLYTGVLLIASKYVFQMVPHKERVSLFGYFIINLLITSSFFAMYLFLSKRYLMAQSFILMLFIPFALNYLIEKINTPYRNLMLTIIFSWMLIANSHLVYSRSSSHYYLQEAGRWIATVVPSTQTVYMNDAFVLYYSKRAQFDFFNTFNQYFRLSGAPADQLDAFDYVVINKNMPNADNLVKQMKIKKATLVRDFTNSHGNQVLVYNQRITSE